MVVVVVEEEEEEEKEKEEEEVRSVTLAYVAASRLHSSAQGFPQCTDQCLRISVHHGDVPSRRESARADNDASFNTPLLNFLVQVSPVESNHDTASPKDRLRYVDSDALKCLGPCRPGAWGIAGRACPCRARVSQ